MAQGAKHKLYLNKKEKGELVEEQRQLSITAALRNQKELTEKVRKESENLLRSQIKFTNFVHSHGLPSTIFTCFAQLAPTLFPDSKIAERWGGLGRDGMRRTKGDYFLMNGIAPFLKEELVENLRKFFFSISVDESLVNKKTELDLM